MALESVASAVEAAEEVAQEAIIERVEIDNAARVEVAAIEANAQVAIAEAQADAVVEVAQAQADAVQEIEQEWLEERFALLEGQHNTILQALADMQAMLSTMSLSILTSPSATNPQTQQTETSQEKPPENDAGGRKVQETARRRRVSM
jgi:regulator of protease activity HflC (stomatin/prohibitin superfamily)